MRDTPAFRLDDLEEIRRLVREYGFATIVSQTTNGLVASHYPIMLDENAPEGSIAILSHVGRPDERLHELGQHEVLAIIQGPHGYISPGWYDANPAVPTWNFVVAHLHGTPEILSDAENLEVLAALVDHFEDRMPEPRRMNGTLANASYAARISSGTVGFRLTATRIEAKSKLSQNRPPETVERIISELTEGENYRNPELAAEMRRVHPVGTTDAPSVSGSSSREGETSVGDQTANRPGAAGTTALAGGTSLDSGASGD